MANETHKYVWTCLHIFITNHHEMKKKDYSWLLYAIILGIALLASSCEDTHNVKVKYSNGISTIENVHRGYSVGDTIMIRHTKVVIVSIVEKR